MRQIVSKARNNVRSIAAKVVAGIAGTLAAGAAFAQTATLASTATSKLTSAEGDVTSILVILVGVVFLFVLYGLIKKAK